MLPRINISAFESAIGSKHNKSGFVISVYRGLKHKTTKHTKKNQDKNFVSSRDLLNGRQNNRNGAINQAAFKVGFIMPSEASASNQNKSPQYNLEFKQNG